jgi:hypothetical protein
VPGTPATSPRFGAPRYANTDTSDFSAQVNAVTDALDLAAKFTSSLSSARPASPVVDQYNWLTDTNVLERWNGTAWVRPTPAPHASSHQDGGTDALTVREAMMATGAPGMAKGAFSAYRNAALSLATGAAVTFDAEEYDVSNWFVGTSFTPQVAGYYLLTWHLEITTVLTTAQWARGNVTKNNVLHKRGSVAVAPSATTTPVTTEGAALVQANGSTDFFAVVLNHNTGGSVALGVGAVDSTYFQAHLVGRS